MAEENNNLAPPVPPHKSTDAAFEQIHRANRFVRVVTIIALLIMVAIMLTFALVRVNQIAEQQRAEAAERARINRELLVELNKATRETQVLICNIINIQPPGQVRPPEVVAQIDKICGPVLSNPEGDKTSFLAPGSDPAPLTISQPATGSSTPPLDNPPTSQPTGTGSSVQPEPPKQTPPVQEPGLVETINPQLSGELCTAQQLITNGCIVR